jgi:hypothetical protein
MLQAPQFDGPSLGPSRWNRMVWPRPTAYAPCQNRERETPTSLPIASGRGLAPTPPPPLPVPESRACRRVEGLRGEGKGEGQRFASDLGFLAPSEGAAHSATEARLKP